MSYSLYKLLGVSKGASEAEIAKAYRNMALKYHPDKCKDPDAGEKIKQLNVAKDILLNADARRTYDLTGKTPAELNQEQAQANADMRQGGFGGMPGGFTFSSFGGPGGNPFGGGVPFGGPELAEFLSRTMGARMGGQFSQENESENVLKLNIIELTKGCTKGVTLKKTYYFDKNDVVATKVPCGCAAQRRGAMMNLMCLKCKNTGTIYPPDVKAVVRETEAQIKVPEHSWPGRVVKFAEHEIKLTLELSEKQQFNNGALQVGLDVHIFEILTDKVKIISPCGTDVEVDTAAAKDLQMKQFDHQGFYVKENTRCNLQVIFNIIYPDKLTGKQKDLCNKLFDTISK